MEKIARNKYLSGIGEFAGKIVIEKKVNCICKINAKASMHVQIMGI